MNDTDYANLGIKVGKTFKQGEPCFTEGVKGIGSGMHIHLEQGTGEFGGGTSPYYKSSDTYTFNGVTYFQYYPNYKNGWEYPVYDMFFVDNNVKWYFSTSEGGKSRYDGKWVTLPTASGTISDAIKDQLNNELAVVKKENEELKNKVTLLSGALTKIAEALKGLT